MRVIHEKFCFFSSRRRHTRWNCDWSSDVCSSDLADLVGVVLVENAIIACSHGGQIQIQIGSGDSRLSVNGVSVVTNGKESNLSFANAKPQCNNKTTTQSPSAAPCITQSATGGLTGKLTVGGAPVLPDSASGTTKPALTPAAVGTWKASSPGQTKLQAT